MSLKFFYALLMSMLSSHFALGQVKRPPQIINLSFDGSKSPNMWKQTLSFAKENNVKFTYFVSSVYFIADNQKKKYVLEGVGTGRSAIGFGGSAEEIQNRISWMDSAIKSGHEIAGHANGHFDGSSWSIDQWMSEFTQFTAFMIEAPEYYGGINNTAKWNKAFLSKSFGFRAPQLGHNEGMYSSMRAHGYVFDASKIAKANQWPRQNKYGIIEFPLAGIKLNRSGKNSVSMDYNIYVAQSGGQTGNSANFQNWEDETFETYINYFLYNYYGNRAPINIGHHFSLWNNGIYWNAYKRFIQSVCNLPEVMCGTHQDAIKFLRSKSNDELLAYQQGQFEKFDRKVTLPVTLKRTSLKNDLSLTDAEIETLKKSSICGPEAHDEDVKYDLPASYEI